MGKIIRFTKVLKNSPTVKDLYLNLKAGKSDTGSKSEDAALVKVSPQDIVEIPMGPITVAVLGESWGSKMSESVKLDSPVKFSLTPVCEYQIVNKWPEGNFYNVNTYPSTETTAKNWLGYISYDGKPTASQIAKLVNAGKMVSCWGKYELDGDQLSIFLTIPKDISELLKEGNS